MLVICGLIVALVALNGGLFYRMVNDQSESLCRERVQIISGELDSELKNAEILIRQAAADMELIRSGGGGITAYEEYIAGKKESIEDESCINVFAAGEDWVYAPGFAEPEGFSYADRVWYKGAVKKGVGKVYISAPYQDAVTANMCFTVSSLLSDRETVVGIDYDLTKLSSDLIYAEVYNMMIFPKEYIGRTVKVSGVFTVYYDEAKDKYHFACFVSDAAACCRQGIEFILEGFKKIILRPGRFRQIRIPASEVPGILD
jgi:hypothetical protein